LRFQGKTRLGFYPLPLSEAKRIRRFILFPDQPSSALDPCVGDGVAFEAITNGGDVLRFGIELDADRAEQARQQIPNIVQGKRYVAAAYLCRQLPMREFYGPLTLRLTSNPAYLAGASRLRRFGLATCHNFADQHLSEHLCGVTIHEFNLYLMRLRRSDLAPARKALNDALS